MDINVLITVYKTLVQPYFDYCSQVWGCRLGTTLSNKLQRMQNRAARIITKCAGYEYRSTALLSYLNLLNLETRRNHQLSILLFKLSQGLRGESFLCYVTCAQNWFLLIISTFISIEIFGSFDIFLNPHMYLKSLLIVWATQ